MNPSHSNDSIANTQNAGQLWIEIALRYCANNRQLRLDVPNLHLLIETLIRSLPIVRNMRSALITRHEAEHNFNKALVRKVSYNEGGCREAFALHARVFSKSLGFVFGGGKWGEELKHQLGDGFQLDFSETHFNRWKPAKWVVNAEFVSYPLKVGNSFMKHVACTHLCCVGHWIVINHKQYHYYHNTTTH